jgi:hypothetical protein
LILDGIVLVLALTIMLETGDITRFSEVGDYASYYRCISGAKFSNGKKKGNTNSKNGNKFLSWAFTEAANFAIRYSEEGSAGVIWPFYSTRPSRRDIHHGLVITTCISGIGVIIHRQLWWGRGE